MIYIVSLIVVGGVLAIDLTTKYFANLQNWNFVVINELLKFKLTFNTGAAFSFLSDKDWAMTFFIAVTFLFMIAVLGFYIYHAVKKKKLSKWLAISCSLIFSGALGNFIDRVALGRVRDFIFVFYNTNIFPAIFNVADMALVIGVIMVCFYLLFLDKDAVFKKSKKHVEKEEDGNKNDND